MNEEFLAIPLGLGGWQIMKVAIPALQLRNRRDPVAMDPIDHLIVSSVTVGFLDSDRSSGIFLTGFDLGMLSGAVLSAYDGPDEEAYRTRAQQNEAYAR